MEKVADENHVASIQVLFVIEKLKQICKCERFLRQTNKGFTFEPVSSVKVLASENQSEQEDGQQAQRANKHRTQIHIYKADILKTRKNHQTSSIIKIRLFIVR